MSCGARKRSLLPVSIILFDLDHFKSINDRYGHLAGDAVLAEVGRRFHHVLRVSDLKCRYGGEEFLGVLPATSLQGAGCVAETLRRDLAGRPVAYNNEALTVTASVGVAQAEPGELEVEKIIGRADAALYRAKRQGRNRVRFEPDAPPPLPAAREVPAPEFFAEPSDPARQRRPRPVTRPGGLADLIRSTLTALSPHKMSQTGLDTYPERLAQLLTDERSSIAARWLARLNEILTVSPNEVFPSDQLLDHIPALIADMASYLRAPEHEEIAANAAVIEKARELGALRFTQKASVHQLLREYEILGELLEEFVAGATSRLDVQPSPDECLEASRRLARSARTLMRTTVDTFVAEYTATLEERNQRIEKFNRMASHELRTPIGTLVFAGALLTKEIAADADRLEQVAAIIRNNTDRLSWLVNNLQRLARLDGPVDSPSHQVVDVAALTAEVRRQLDEMALARGVDIRVDPTLPTVHSDPARLELVLLNLVSNGIKYRDPANPGAFVEVTHGKEADGDGHWTLCVKRQRTGHLGGRSRGGLPAVLPRACPPRRRPRRLGQRPGSVDRR